MLSYVLADQCLASDSFSLQPKTVGEGEGHYNMQDDIIDARKCLMSATDKLPTGHVLALFTQALKHNGYVYLIES